MKKLIFGAIVLSSSLSIYSACPDLRGDGWSGNGVGRTFLLASESRRDQVYLPPEKNTFEYDTKSEEVRFKVEGPLDLGTLKTVSAEVSMTVTEVRHLNFYKAGYVGPGFIIEEGRTTRDYGVICKYKKNEDRFDRPNPRTYSRNMTVNISTGELMSGEEEIFTIAYRKKGNEYKPRIVNLRTNYNTYQANNTNDNEIELTWNDYNRTMRKLAFALEKNDENKLRIKLNTNGKAILNNALRIDPELRVEFKFIHLKRNRKTAWNNWGFGKTEYKLEEQNDPIDVTEELLDEGFQIINNGEEISTEKGSGDGEFYDNKFELEVRYQIRSRKIKRNVGNVSTGEVEFTLQ